VVRQLRAEGRVRRGYLGISLHEVGPDLAQLLKMSEEQGALVVEVVHGQPAEEAGLRRWDVITALDGQPVQNGDDLVRTVSALAPGREVPLSVWRDGAPLRVVARLGERPGDIDFVPDDEDELLTPTDAGETGDVLGLAVRDVGSRARAEMDIPPDRAGVSIRAILGADPGTDVLAEGDIVMEINRRPTPNVAAYRRVVDSLGAGESAWLLVYRPQSRDGSFLTRIEVGPRP